MLSMPKFLTRWLAPRRLLAPFVLVAALAQCAPQCAPGPSCATISWPGRSPVCVVPTAPPYTSAATARASALLNAGNAVDLSGDTNPNNGAHVAGHYSSHGAIFNAGPNLRPGTVVVYANRRFTVRYTSSSYAGAPYHAPAAGQLVVQYSGCGGVCLVHAS